MRLTQLPTRYIVQLAFALILITGVFWYITIGGMPIDEFKEEPNVMTLTRHKISIMPKFQETAVQPTVTSSEYMPHLGAYLNLGPIEDYMSDKYADKLADLRTSRFPKTSLKTRYTETLLIGRFAGNNMPPLQGYSQVRQNLMYAHANEDLLVRFTRICGIKSQNGTISIPQEPKKKTEHMVLVWVETAIYRKHGVLHGNDDIIVETHMPAGPDAVPGLVEDLKVKSVVLINHILNYTESYMLKEDLHSINIPFYELPLNANILYNSANSMLYLSNQNGARNSIVEMAKLLGATWVAPFDGNMILSREAYSGLGRAIFSSARKHKYYALVPMYRILGEYEELNFNGKTNMENLGVTDIVVQEAQIMLSTLAPRLYPEFGRYTHYGRNNKFALLMSLHTKYKAITYCEKASSSGYGKFKQEVVPLQELIHVCGATFRLPYNAPKSWYALRRKSVVVHAGARYGLRNDAKHLLTQLSNEAKESHKSYRRLVNKRSLIPF